ncbi:MAG: type III pantothenate kinase [Oscillospiraceae bacterium]|nr:type III pantothenate kinase [Oscillospiraceae bacterium]
MIKRQKTATVKKMLLTVDAGNTNIVFAVFEKDKCVLESRINTDSTRMADQYAIALADIMRLHNVEAGKISGAIVSSVVPPVTAQLVNAIKTLTSFEPLTVGPGLKTGLNIKIDNPAELGADLVCGAVAAKTLYNPPCIAIDLGTVTKVMAIDKTGALIGGVLAPGVGAGFRTMAQTTTTLPLVGAGEFSRVIGTNSPDCIKSGIIYGTACMLDGLTEQFEKEIGERCSIVVTGGYSEIIVPHCKRKVTQNKALVSVGMRIIYEKNKGS